MPDTAAPVGFAGLGRMGTAMALRLLDQAIRLVVWNRSPAATSPLAAAGAEVADSPAVLAEHCPVVITMLRDDAAARQVYLGEQGLLGACARDRLFIEMSTLKPATVRALHERAAEWGATLVDSPVSGTVAPARAGQLVALAGGTEDALKRARPLLEKLARRIVHAGPPGSGALLKLVVNLPLAVYWHALGEALALGESGGLDRALMLDTIADSSAALAVLRLKIPTLLGQTEEVAFDLASMRKDLLIIIEAAASAGTDMTAAACALGAYSAAVSAGLGGRDVVEVAREKRLPRQEARQ